MGYNNNTHNNNHNHNNSYARAWLVLLTWSFMLLELVPKDVSPIDLRFFKFFCSF